MKILATTRVYHVLGGIISPMDGVGPGDITVASLIDRVGKTGERIEVIFALPATMEGEQHHFTSLKTEGLKC